MCCGKREREEERGEKEGTRIRNSRGKRNNTEDKEWHHRGRGRDKKEEKEEKGNRGEGKIMFVSRVEEEREPAVRSSSEVTGQQQEQEQE